METMIQAVNSCTISPECQTAESPLQPEQSFKEVLQKQSASEEKNKDLGQGNVAAGFLLNLLAILPNLCVRNNLNKANQSKLQFPGQLLSQEPEQNILALTAAQAKPDPSASATSVRRGIPNITLNQGATSADPMNIREEGMALLLDNRPGPSPGKLLIQSQIHEGTVQAKGTFPKSELNPSFFMNQEETIIACSESDVINKLPEGQKTPISVAETTLPSPPWATRNEEIKNVSFKSESNANILGQKITPAVYSPDSPMPAEFNGTLDVLLGQISTGEELLGRSTNGESSALRNSPAEKNSLKVISAGENHPAQDPFSASESPASAKLPTTVEETGIQQEVQVSKTDHLGLYQQISEKIIWSLANNQEKILLTLDPPQLGNLFIELHRDKEGIKATLWADNPKTKEMLENNQFQLQKNLEGHGFKLEKYEVFVQNDMGSFQRKEENPIFRGEGGRKQSPKIEEGELLPSPEILPGAIPASGGSQYIDRFI